MNGYYISGKGWYVAAIPSGYSGLYRLDGERSFVYRLLR